MFTNANKSCLAEVERETGNEEGAGETTRWVRTEADATLQTYHDLVRLLYDTEDHGGPAGRKLFPEINKAARQMLDVAQEVTARTGQEVDLHGMTIHGPRTIPEDYVPGTMDPDPDREGEEGRRSHEPDHLRSSGP